MPIRVAIGWRSVGWWIGGYPMQQISSAMVSDRELGADAIRPSCSPAI